MKGDPVPGPTVTRTETNLNRKQLGTKYLGLPPYILGTKY